MSLWNRYEPSPDAPWNLKRVHHLHRRAAFGATWNEIQRDLGDTPQAAIGRVLTGTCRSEACPPNSLVAAEPYAEWGKTCLLRRTSAAGPAAKRRCRRRPSLRVAMRSPILSAADLNGLPQPWNPEPLLARHQVRGGLPEIVRFFGELLFGNVGGKSLDVIATSIDHRLDRSSQIRQAVIALLTRPQAHLH